MFTVISLNKDHLFWCNYLGNTDRGYEAYKPIQLNEENLIHPHITPANFVSFLWVFYNPRYTLYETTKEIWLKIQHYTISWEMNEIQDLTYQELTKLENN